jgi:hypothetical protein
MVKIQHIDVAMMVLFEKKLQHQGYESHQYSIYYISRRFENKCFQYLHINMNHWILYDSRTPHDKILYANTKLKLNELMNIDNLNYTYANVMQQPDQSSCGSFAIVYVIAFNINVEKSKYVWSLK